MGWKNNIKTNFKSKSSVKMWEGRERLGGYYSPKTYDKFFYIRGIFPTNPYNPPKQDIFKLT